MTAIENTPFQPFYIETETGSLFATYFPAMGEPKGNYICVAPFAEEMNRCRSMIAMQARAFAQQGIGVLLIDLYGTGESAGDFEDASWENWKSSVRSAAKWLEDQNLPLTGLWGIRLGCLLAADVISEPSLKVDKLVFWHPVISGKTMLTQFLRIKIAAAMDLGGDKETTKGMRQSLANGDIIEVGGYALTSKLTQPIDDLKMTNLLPEDAYIIWLEQVEEEAADLSIASQRLFSDISEGNAKIIAKGFTGPAFWQLHERAVAPNLIELTTTLCLASQP